MVDPKLGTFYSWLCYANPPRLMPTELIEDTSCSRSWLISSNPSGYGPHVVHDWAGVQEFSRVHGAVHDHGHSQALSCACMSRERIYSCHTCQRPLSWAGPRLFMKVYVKGSRPILDAPRIVCTPSQTCLHVINLLRLSQIRVHIWLYVI